MNSVGIDLEEEVMARWQRLAQAHGVNAEEEMQAAILDRLEELEDWYISRSRLARPFEPVPNEEAWRRIGERR